MNAVRDEPYASTFQVHGAATVRSAVSGPSNGLAAVHGCIGSAFTFWTVQVARVTPAEPATRLGLVESRRSPPNLQCCAPIVFVEPHFVVISTKSAHRELSARAMSGW
jgi:hypothetical protein